jgi:hypothetical protein
MLWFCTEKPYGFFQVLTSLSFHSRSWVCKFHHNYKPLTFGIKREYVKLLNGESDLIKSHPTPMEQSLSRKANFRHLLKLKVHYRVYNSVSLVSILNHIKSFEVLPAYSV